jgi:selenocysteine-specific elongation factor
MEAEAMKNIIVGTAGHIDHGKTSLVKAITGIDTDRLAEEKRRGITIDLGFAHLQLTKDIRLGFVDVPGHERFVRNMLAGVGGIDVVLFVIAADESIKPQTREHFDICALLGIRHGVIALTKADLVDAEILDLVKLEVEELVAGSFLEKAEIVAVSSATGAGLDHLREALLNAANAVQPKDPGGPMRLPIDRSFTVPGFGTVVTGTLISGSIEVEDEAELLPSGRLMRVRGVQSYGAKVPRVTAGTRAALNLAGIEHTQVHRGMVLAEAGLFHAVRLIDVSLSLLPGVKAVKHRAPVHFHCGTSETPAELRLFSGASLEPGSFSLVRIALARPVVLAPGDRFILRRFSPVMTIGGGRVVDILPPRIRNAEDAMKRLQVLAGSDVAAKVAWIARESQIPMSARDLGARLGIRPEETVALARGAPITVIEPGPWIVSNEWLLKKAAEITRMVRAHHLQVPLEGGISKSDLRSKVLPDAAPPVFEALLKSCRELVVQAELVRHQSHRVALNSEEDTARLAILRQFESSGLATPSISEVLEASGVDLARARTILQMLLKERLLVRISDSFILHSTAISKIREILSVNRHSSFSVADFKGWTGVSRKYAVPLLEYCDRERMTLRHGDHRTIL